MTLRARAFAAACVALAWATTATPRAAPPTPSPAPNDARALYDAATDRWAALPRPPYATYDVTLHVDRRGRTQVRKSTVAVRVRDRTCRIVGVPIDARDRVDKPQVTNRCLAPDTALTFLGTRRDDGASGLPVDVATPGPEPSADARTIAHVVARARTYEPTYVGDETIDDVATAHLALRPYGDPNRFLARDVWIDRATSGVVRLHGVARLAVRVASVDFIATYREDGHAQELRDLVGYAKAQLLLVKVGADFRVELANVAYPASLPDATFDPHARS